MKLMSFRDKAGRAGWGTVEGEQVADLSATAPSLRAALAAGKPIAVPANAPRVPLAGLTYLPPIPDPDKIICVGLNYLSHIQEGGREVPKQPTIFTRWANTQVGHMQALVRPKASATFDYEGELAFVVGKRCRHVAEADALSTVAGYACYNDGSVREWQRHSSQFTPGKNFPATGGFGPFLVTPDEAGDITKATLTTRLNGEEVQKGRIDDLVFGVARLVAYCSTFTVLEPGDVVITGTTGGVGAYRKPPLWMRAGDTVEVEISGVGTLTNPVVDEA